MHMIAHPSLNILIKNFLGSFIQILRLYIFQYIPPAYPLAYLLCSITTSAPAPVSGVISPYLLFVNIKNKKKIFFYTLQLNLLFLHKHIFINILLIIITPIKKHPQKTLLYIDSIDSFLFFLKTNISFVLYH